MCVGPSFQKCFKTTDLVTGTVYGSKTTRETELGDHG